MNLHSAAIEYARLGYRVFPLVPGKKSPLTKNGLRDATTDLGQIDEWWGATPMANIGLLVSKRDLILDLEDKNGKNGLSELQKHGHFDISKWRGPIARTPTGEGRHVLMRWSMKWLPPSTAEKTAFPGIDIRGFDKAYIAVAPSVVDPGEYSWIVPMCAPKDIPEAPEWIVRLLSPGKRPKDIQPRNTDQLLRQCTAKLSEAEEGERNSTLNLCAYRLGQWSKRGIDKAKAEYMLIAASPPFDRGFTAEQFDRTFNSGWEAGKTNALPPRADVGPGLAIADYSDISNAERLLMEHGSDLLHCDGLGGWLVWSGRRFRASKGTEFLAKGAEIAQRIYSEALDGLSAAKTEEDQAFARAAVAKAEKCQSKGRIEASMGLAAHRVAVDVTELDTDPYLFNVNNGTIDLRTGKLLPHDREHRITKIAPIEYDPDATHPLWDDTLAQIIPDFDTRAYLRRLFGYAMIGEVLEHTYPIFYGSGRNGKGTLFETLKEVFGDYASTLPKDEITNARQQRHPEGRANLRGKRLVITSEINRGDKLDEAGLKELTGGDSIRAARKYSHEIEFRPTWLMAMQVNHMPLVQGQDDGLWGRLERVVFDQSFLGREDKTLPMRLKDPEVLAAVLAWCVRGCLEYQARGIRVPKAVQASTKAYRADSDPLAEWLECYCETMTQDEVKKHPLKAKATTATQRELYLDFSEWQRNEGYKTPYTSTSFARMLEAQGFKRSTKRRNSSRIFVGIKLLKNYERQVLEDKRNKEGSI